MRRIVAMLAAVVAFSACPGPEDEVCPITPTFAGLPTVSLDSQGQFLQVGTVALQVFTSAAGQCPSGRRTLPEAVRMRVFAPDGTEVTPDVTFHPGSDAAVVRVNATMPGWYHVEANFLPSYGLTQLDFLVTRPITPDTSTVLPVQCSRLDRTASGAWLCDHRLFRGTEAVDSVSEPFFRWTAGDDIWTAAFNDIRRFTDTGTGGLVLANEATVSVTNSFSSARGQGEDSLIARHSFGLFRLTAQPDGGIEQTHGSNMPFGEMVHVAGDLVLVDEFGERGAVLQTYGLDDADAGFVRVGAPRPFSSVMGNSDDGIWTLNGTDLRLFSASDGGVVARGSIAVPGDLFAQRSFNGPPVMTASFGQGGAVLVQRGDAGLELVHLSSVPFLSGTGDGYAWTTNFDGTTQIFTW